MPSSEVYFLIEHKARELTQVSKIAKILRDRHNISSRLFSTFFHMHLLLFMPKPKAIVVPYGMSEHIWPMNYLRFLYGDSVHYIHLSWEQYLFASNKAYKAPRDSFFKKQFHYLAWEPFFKGWLIEEGVPATSIHVCGNPNIEKMAVFEQEPEALKTKLSEFYDFESYQKTVYFPMNYAWSFLSERAIEARIKFGYKRDDAFAYRNYSIKSREAFLSFLNEIAAQNPDIGFIIRPHPGVDIEQYKELFRERRNDVPSNVHFINELSAHEWVLCSDVVGSSVSTVCYDAHLFGKPSFYFAPFPHPSCLDSEFLNTPPRVKNVSEFNMFIQDIETKKAVPSKLKHSEESAQVIAGVLMTDCLKSRGGGMKWQAYFYMVFVLLRSTVAAFLSPYVTKFKHMQADKFSVIRFSKR